MMMTMRQTRSLAITLLAAALAFWPRSSSAAPQQLICVLTAAGGQPSSQSRSMTVTFDENAKTLSAKVGNQNYSFANVSISTVAISGDIDTISIGIDRSSLGLIWQQYGTDKADVAYGQCRANSPAAASP